ncbi:MAG: flavin reductase family protein [Alphaproteobacteria bacterium]
MTANPSETWRTAADTDALAAGLREGLRGLAKAVVVVTCRDGDARYAMVATAVSEVSMNPPSMLICVNKSASLFPVLSEGADFCINILNAAQADIANQCSVAKGEERFAIGVWRDSKLGPPVLQGAQASFVCRNISKMEQGTHGVFIGEVAAVTNSAPIDPLVYMDRRYSRVAD